MQKTSQIVTTAQYFQRIHRHVFGMLHYLKGGISFLLWRYKEGDGLTKQQRYHLTQAHYHLQEAVKLEAKNNEFVWMNGSPKSKTRNRK